LSMLLEELGLIDSQDMIDDDDDDGLSRTVHVIGESFGGVIAQHFALTRPDAIASLTLISSLCHTELTPIVKFKVCWN
jgi:pimeloyl-ACP methyl ester carboxylesterase